MPEENNNSVMLIDLASLFSKSGTSLEMIVVVNKVFDQKHLFFLNLFGFILIFSPVGVAVVSFNGM